MRKVIISIAIGLITSLMAQAQIKIINTGCVGIGTGNTFQDYVKVYVNNNATVDAVWHNGLLATTAVTNSTNNNYLIGTRGITYNATALTNTGKAFGVYGQAGNIGNGYNYGVFGQLLGNNSGAGVFGSSCSSDYGIVGKYAGYFYGDVRIVGRLYLPGGEVFGTSDKNSKKDIVNLDNDNITRLKKITGIKFKYKTMSEMGFASSDSSKQSEKENDVKNKIYLGVIAQDVQQVYPELVQTDQNGLLSVNYIGFIPILIESVKDLQKQVDNKDTKLANQQSDIDDLKQQVIDLRAIIAGCCSTKTKLKSNAETDFQNSINTTITTTLYQNAPNPFKENTSIRIDLPQNVGKALLNIYDLTGKQLKTYNIAERGIVTVIINGKDLVAGMYHYALITDGNLIDTKTMILTE